MIEVSADSHSQECFGFVREVDFVVVDLPFFFFFLLAKHKIHIIFFLNSITLLIYD